MSYGLAGTLFSINVMENKKEFRTGFHIAGSVHLNSFLMSPFYGGGGKNE